MMKAHIKHERERNKRIRMHTDDYLTADPKQHSCNVQTLLQGKQYIHSDMGTDVQVTWRKFGWHPIREQTK